MLLKIELLLKLSRVIIADFNSPDTRETDSSETSHFYMKKASLVKNEKELPFLRAPILSREMNPAIKVHFANESFTNSDWAIFNLDSIGEVFRRRKLL